MSDGGRETREWRFYVADRIEFGEKVLFYTHERSPADKRGIE